MWILGVHGNSMEILASLSLVSYKVFFKKLVATHQIVTWSFRGSVSSIVKLMWIPYPTGTVMIQEQSWEFGYWLGKPGE